MKRRKPQFEFSAIGHVDSCFKEKFGIPRQPGLVAGASGMIKLDDDPDLRTAIKGLEGFSHLWILFVFHEHGGKNWKPSIRPPRLGGAKKVGVLASRSPHRPNPIGMSVVAITAIRVDAPGGPEIDVTGLDLLDGTPVIDIKPYVPYADSVPDARGGWAHEPIPRVEVEFTEIAERDLVERGEGRGGYAYLKNLVIEMLTIDPRPASQRRKLPATSPETQGTRYAFYLLDFDVKWEVRDEKFVVLELADVVKV